MLTPTHTPDALRFNNRFASLPEHFYTRLNGSGLPDPYLVGVSPSAAQLLGLDPAQLTAPESLAVLAGQRAPAAAAPLAAVYSGHQFGVWAGQLGDGRAILLGDVETPEGPMELQWKGAGLTPYSRMGDGRAVLRSSIREFLCSEAMHALGIPTTRALSVVGSDLGVVRESIETAAVVIRMAPSFVRFGSFEHWYYGKHNAALRQLADHVIAHFYPELAEADNPYQALLAEVTRRTGKLIAQWQAVGFMHGVMNTDNMSILGQTLDYGPFGYMEAFDAHHICNHSDNSGRYSYANQPRIGEWNCFALGQALVPLIGSVDATHAALEAYGPAYSTAMDELLHAKLGLKATLDQDEDFFNAMYAMLQATRVDYTLFFRRLAAIRRDDPAQDGPVRDLFIDRAACDAWLVQYRARLRQEDSADAPRQAAMRAVNPKYVLRNYLAQVAIEKAQNKDFSEVQRLLSVLAKPYDEQEEHAAYAALPPDWASGLEVSCSS
ncbi:YdiU family protein [Massilia sp. TS11]|uniref:protein adenylyltransferase SelO n=1 Tax=Massilia sp. TS11 TaxID=2908003 RepID=UPI001EDB316E|nr:YdiU family protein [Massilia sp. TS11]MCG2584693.1 YdiU family protein [Massilia sp. TS11]